MSQAWPVKRPGAADAARNSPHLMCAGTLGGGGLPSAKCRSCFLLSACFFTPRWEHHSIILVEADLNHHGFFLACPCARLAPGIIFISQSLCPLWRMRCFSSSCSEPSSWSKTASSPAVANGVAVGRAAVLAGRVAAVPAAASADDDGGGGELAAWDWVLKAAASAAPDCFATGAVALSLADAAGSLGERALT